MSSKKFSDSIWENDNTDKAFEKFQDTVKMLEFVVNKDINSLKSQVEIKPIQQLGNLLIRHLKIDIYSGGGWYDKEKFRIRVSKELYEVLKNSDICKSMPFETGAFTSDYIFSTPINDGVKDYIGKIIEVIKEYDENIHNQNLVVVSDNMESKKALMDLLKRIGVKEQYLDYKTKRSRNKEWLTYNWVYELGNQFPTGYYSSTMKDAYESKIREVNDVINRKLNQIKEEEKKKQDEIDRKTKERELALYLGKYGLDITGSWNDVLSEIINKNKYLRLAHYLQENRNDWTDGCWYAECGLDAFVIETEVDMEIDEDIRDYIENWSDHQDGRVFRDCRYNYSVLYGMVEDKELMSEYSLVCEKSGKY